MVVREVRAELNQPDETRVFVASPAFLEEVKAVKHGYAFQTYTPGGQWMFSDHPVEGGVPCVVISP